MGLEAAIIGTGVLGAVASDRASSKARRTQVEASDQQTQLIREATAQARKDIDRLSPMAQENLLRGNQTALNIFGGLAPAQMDIFQQGNVGAQQALLSGLPQIQNALLGMPTDFSALQPQQLQMPDMSFMNTQLPNFVGAGFDPASHTVNPNPVIPPNVGTGDGLISRVLAGAQGNPVGGSGMLSGMTDRLLSKINSGQPRDSVLGGAVDRLTERIR